MTLFLGYYSQRAEGDAQQAAQLMDSAVSGLRVQHCLTLADVFKAVTCPETARGTGQMLPLQGQGSLAPKLMSMLSDQL